MTAPKFHLGWFLGGYYPQAWNVAFGGDNGKDWMSADRWIEFTKTLETACFDFMVCEDSSWVPRAFGDSIDYYVEHAFSVPKQDPGVLTTLIMAGTSKIGVVPTLSTGEWQPYPVARMVGTMDQISKGRAGWNIVTGSSDLAVQNYGRDHIYPHDERYERADEFADVVFRLWDSWEPDSIVADKDRDVFADPAKVHDLDHDGEYFKVRGPLVSGPTPQGRPVIVQAGGSARGREFAAKNADVIIASCTTVEQAKAYREDVRRLAEENGRGADSVKVLFVVHPIVAETDELAEARIDAIREAARQDPANVFAGIGYVTEVDFSGLDPDALMEDATKGMTTDGNQSSLDDYLNLGRGLTVREFAAKVAWTRRMDVIGSVETCADTMEHIMEEVGGDGFLFLLPTMTRKAVAEITDGLIPELQRRGLMRTEYSHDQFRDNLFEF